MSINLFYSALQRSDRKSRKLVVTSTSKIETSIFHENCINFIYGVSGTGMPLRFMQMELDVNHSNITLLYH